MIGSVQESMTLNSVNSIVCVCVCVYVTVNWQSGSTGNTFIVAETRNMHVQCHNFTIKQFAWFTIYGIEYKHTYIAQ